MMPRVQEGEPEVAGVPVLLLVRDASTPPYADALQAGADAWLNELVEPLSATPALA